MAASRQALFNKPVLACLQRLVRRALQTISRGWLPWPAKNQDREDRQRYASCRCGFRSAIVLSDTTAGGKTVHVRVESVKQPGVTNIRTWGAHERVAVRRG